MCQVRLATSTSLYSWLWLRHVYSANAYLSSYPLPQYVMYMLSTRGRSENRDMPLPHPHSSHSHRCDKPLRSTNALLLTQRYNDHSNWVRCHCDVLKTRSSGWGDYVVITGRDCMLAVGWVELFSGSGRRKVAKDKSHLIWCLAESVNSNPDPGNKGQQIHVNFHP